VNVMTPEEEKAAKARFIAFIREWVKDPEANGGLSWLQDNGIDALTILLEELDALEKNSCAEPVPKIVLQSWLPRVLVEAGLVASTSQGKQLIEQGGVRVNNEKVVDCALVLEPGHYLVSVGTKSPKDVWVIITKYAGG